MTDRKPPAAAAALRALPPGAGAARDARSVPLRSSAYLRGTRGRASIPACRRKDGQPPQYEPAGSLAGSPARSTARLALIALAAVAVAFLVMAIPTDVVRDRVVAEVKARTGRDLVIAGPASFTLYPSVGVSLGDVSLSGAPGSGGKPLVTMGALDVSVRLLPLLQRERAREPARSARARVQPRGRQRGPQELGLRGGGRRDSRRDPVAAAGTSRRKRQAAPARRGSGPDSPSRRQGRRFALQARQARVRRRPHRGRHDPLFGRALRRRTRDPCGERFAHAAGHFLPAERQGQPRRGRAGMSTSTAS